MTLENLRDAGEFVAALTVVWAFAQRIVTQVSKLLHRGQEQQQVRFAGLIAELRQEIEANRQERKDQIDVLESRMSGRFDAQDSGLTEVRLAVQEVTDSDRRHADRGRTDHEDLKTLRGRVDSHGKRLQKLERKTPPEIG